MMGCDGNLQRAAWLFFGPLALAACIAATYGHALDAGDAALLQAESDLSLTQGQNAEVLVFDLAA